MSVPTTSLQILPEFLATSDATELQTTTAQITAAQTNKIQTTDVQKTASHNIQYTLFKDTNQARKKSSEMLVLQTTAAHATEEIMMSAHTKVSETIETPTMEATMTEVESTKLQNTKCQATRVLI